MHAQLDDGAAESGCIHTKWQPTSRQPKVIRILDLRFSKMFLVSMHQLAAKFDESEEDEKLELQRLLVPVTHVP